MPAMGGHGGGKPGVQSSGNMTSPCYTDPSAAECKGFMRTHPGAGRRLRAPAVAAAGRGGGPLPP